MTDDATKLHEFNPGAVRFETQRCYECGRWWAYERFRADEVGCPVCAGKQIVRLNTALFKASRVISALKGALKRSKKR